jgi:hypothetical protein
MRWCCRPLAAAAAFLWLAACSTTTWQTDKYVAPGYSGASKNVYIVYSLSDDKQALDHEALQETLKRELEGCDIASRSMTGKVIYHKDKDSSGALNLSALGADVTATNPDAILFVAEKSNTKTL